MMISERMLMKVFTFDPHVEVTIFGRSIQVKSKTVFDILVYSISVFSSLQFVLKIELNDIFGFLRVLQQVLYTITAAVNILAHFDLNKSYDQLVKIVVPVSSSAQTERVVLALVLLKLWMILSSVALMVSINPELQAVVNFLAFALENFSVLEASALKHLVADRLKRATRMEPVDGLVSTTRRILDCNCQLNSDCSPTTTMVNVTVIYHFMNYWYWMWKLFRGSRADEEESAWEVQHPLMMTLTLASFYFNVFIFSHFSSEVSDSVSVDFKMYVYTSKM